MSRLSSARYVLWSVRVEGDPFYNTIIQLKEGMEKKKVKDWPKKGMPSKGNVEGGGDDRRNARTSKSERMFGDGEGERRNESSQAKSAKGVMKEWMISQTG